MKHSICRYRQIVNKLPIALGVVMVLKLLEWAFVSRVSRRMLIHVAGGQIFPLCCLDILSFASSSKTQ
jgi:hypothetical protein